MNKPLKIILYLLLTIVYAVLYTQYLKQLILNLTNELPMFLRSFVLSLSNMSVAFIPVFAIFKYKKMKEEQKNGLAESIYSDERRLWRGDLPLRSAFWGYQIPFSLIYSILGWYLAFRYSDGSLRPLLFWIYAFGIIIHSISITIGTWRSSKHYLGSRNWILLARIGVIFSSAFILFALVIESLGIKIFK